MATIGIDLRALQTGHKYRGIGEVAKQVTNRVLAISAKEKKDIDFIFYEYCDKGNDPKELIDIPDTITYRVIKVGPMPEKAAAESRWSKLLRAYKALYGEPIKGSGACDVYLQFDYAFGVPGNTRTVLMLHDIIPIVFWRQFFTSPWTHIKHKAARTTFRTIFHNYRYLRVLKRSLRSSYRILAISEHTKKDLIARLGANAKKIDVVYLGVDIKPAKTAASSYFELPSKPFIFFVGAGDARRRVEDAVAAYNNLKAEGHDIQLVLVGENFQKPEAIPNIQLRKSVLSSSYRDDIILMGYVSDEAKQRLFSHAIAFVYPTLYEGFGIPVLESMLLNCPIISYKNSSIPEVGGKYVLYANGWEGIKYQVECLLAMSDEERKALLAAARKHAERFTWDKTSNRVYDYLLDAL